jgi:hypothetical protein
LSTVEDWFEPRLYYQDFVDLTGLQRFHIETIEKQQRWEFATPFRGTGYVRMYSFVDALIMRIAADIEDSDVVRAGAWEIARDEIRQIVLEIGVRRLRTEHRVEHGKIGVVLKVGEIIADFEAGGLGRGALLKARRVSLLPAELVPSPRPNRLK